MEFFADWFFGGREGCLAACYAPTAQELLRGEHRRLLRMVRGIERDLTKEAGNLQSLQKRIVSDASAGKWEVARRRAIELHRSRRSFDRLGTQKDNILNVADRLKQQMTAVSVDQSLLMLVRIMAARVQMMQPDRFARLLKSYEDLKGKESMTERQMQDFFGKEDDAQEDRPEGNDERRVAVIFAELGIRELGPAAPTATPAISDAEDEDAGDDVNKLEARFDALRNKRV